MRIKKKESEEKLYVIIAPRLTKKPHTYSGMKLVKNGSFTALHNIALKWLW